MTSYAIPTSVSEHYAYPVAKFEHLLGWLAGEHAQGATHSEVEAMVQVEGSELLRGLIQGYLDLKRPSGAPV